jgi:hypothetical protein
LLTEQGHADPTIGAACRRTQGRKQNLVESG